ncbi:PREDICTED: ABSCISIC ACID-INSENSITIVE 5-like protein 3 [Fragaria vesca subsp. vesca]|uniref:ABSCISIC ACID-INSENSITIVE 5-like protein 3 n=1 Tax=Fragaria vesca subsp. vesca TaxID=101020 RepID=UPI0002C31D09|nr:PREDICTED: ABSCISIC ACID-INSENSITIVE 5-like protein 3 [Fragaria vesca subsp. vesca]
MDDRTLVSGNGDEKPQFPPLAGQGSNYNLTLDRNEVESNLGNMSKPLNTRMAHLDEFLKNVISVDQEVQLLQHASSSCSSLPTSLFLGNFNLNGPLMSTTKKKITIDEVWKEIAHHDHHSLNLNSAAAHDSLHHQRMTTIGEPTTETTPPEHLLVRAGILNAHQMMPIDPEAVVSQQADWFQFQVAAAAAAQQMTMLDSNFTVCESVFENSSSAMNLDNFSENHQVGMSIPLPEISAASSSESQATHAERKRNYSDEMKEKSIERRQKRMIKNRESAARSRARKQAYTNQLESKVSHLEKMNTWLKKQKEVEILLSSNPTNSMPTYQLRRTSSASF